MLAYEIIPMGDGRRWTLRTEVSQNVNRDFRYDLSADVVSVGGERNEWSRGRFYYNSIDLDVSTPAFNAVFNPDDELALNSALNPFRGNGVILNLDLGTPVIDFTNIDVGLTNGATLDSFTTPGNSVQGSQRIVIKHRIS